MSRLTGKVALVTGAGRGMGRVIACRLAREGASVIVHYSSSRSGAEETVSAIRDKGGNAFMLQADIGNRAEVKRLFENIDRKPSRLDIIVNSSGISGGGKLANLDDDEFESMLNVNLRGPLYVASEAATRLKEGGRIINIGSTMSEFPLGGAGVYSATKAALKSFTESWAKELGTQGVTVNTIIPGATRPGMADSTPEQYRAIFENASPFKRVGRAEEIASVVVFLASEESSWVSGTHIMANGAADR